MTSVSPSSTGPSTKRPKVRSNSIFSSIMMDTFLSSPTSPREISTNYGLQKSSPLLPAPLLPLTGDIRIMACSPGGQTKGYILLPGRKKTPTTESLRKNPSRNNGISSKTKSLSLKGRFRSQFNWSLSNLVAMLRYNLFTYRDLWEWLNKPFNVPALVPVGEQMRLEFSNIGQQNAI